MERIKFLEMSLNDEKYKNITKEDLIDTVIAITKLSVEKTTQFTPEEIIGILTTKKIFNNVPKEQITNILEYLVLCGLLGYSFVPENHNFLKLQYPID